MNDKAPPSSGPPSSSGSPGTPGAKTAKAPEPRRVLGRGLDALLPVAHGAAIQRAESPFQQVGIERLHPRKDQPRKRFDDEALGELAASLRQQGVIQPLIVRRLPGATPGTAPGTAHGAAHGAAHGGETEYEIIAGERRWRAAQRAGLHEVPVVIKDVTTDEAYELALVENLQRQDLDPVETAQAYKRLLDEYGYSQEALAVRVGKNRSTVANTLRLLQLPAEVLDRVVARELSEGHARAILSAEQPEEIRRLARDAVAKQWSVRQTEQAARRKKPAPGAPAPDAAEIPGAAPEARKSPNVRDLEKRLEAALGMSVAIRQDSDARSGTVEIAYNDLDQLDRFLDRVLGG